MKQKSIDPSFEEKVGEFGKFEEVGGVKGSADIGDCGIQS
jgi:hypothetical protein